MTDERYVYGTPENGEKGSPAPCMEGTVLIPQRESFMGKALAFTLGFVAGVAALGAVAYLCKDQTTYSDDDDEDEQPDATDEEAGNVPGREKQEHPSAAEAAPDEQKEKVDTLQTDANDSAETDAAGASA